jgi:hypothetical protein
MLKSGVPAEHAILYFTASTDPAEIALILQKWLKSKPFQKAQKTLDGKDWTEMSTEEMCDRALEQTYRGMAYLLYTTHYVSANPNEKSKIDTARTALEARKAGTAGKVDPIWQFIEDYKKDKLKGKVQ